MRILLTGGAGFIGSHIAEMYLESGHDVLIVDDLSTGKRRHLPGGAEFVQADIRDTDLDQVFQRFQPEVVNHHAAQASVKLSSGDPVADLSVNGGGTAWISTLAVKHGVGKLVYAASGGTVYGDPQRLPVDESHPLGPISPYGTSKFVGEEYVRLAHRTGGIDFTILRYGNIYGPRQDPQGEAGVVAIFTGKMLSGKQCTIDGDGEQKKDYIYVGDVARANVLALDSGPGVTCNIGTGKGLSVNKIFNTLSEATSILNVPRPGDPHRHISVRRRRSDMYSCQQCGGWDWWPESQRWLLRAAMTVRRCRPLRARESRPPKPQRRPLRIRLNPTPADRHRDRLWYLPKRA